jgi:hypothetical protein
LRTFGSVFPQMEVWDVDDGDIVMLGSEQPWPSGPEACRRAFELEMPRRDLAEIGVVSPEAALARRLASQRTAFAIPGPGPVQRDSHPILEYAAPRAFYLYLQRQGVQRLLEFDERTWQMDLVSWPERDLPTLKDLFARDYHTVNSALRGFLLNRFQGQVGTQVIRNRAMPCVFTSTNLVLYAAPSAATNGLTRQLYNAEYAFRHDPSFQARAAEAILNVLDRAPSDYNPKRADWSAAYYANVAINLSLRLAKPAQARAVLLRGLQLDPASPQLAYLARILVREGIVQPAELPASNTAALGEVAEPNPAAAGHTVRAGHTGE